MSEDLHRAVLAKVEQYRDEYEKFTTHVVFEAGASAQQALQELCDAAQAQIANIETLKNNY